MITITSRQLPFGLVEIVTISNSAGASVVLSSLGAGIVEINVPDAVGRMDNVAMTYGNLADYLADGPCCGKTPGRYANRIGHGKLTVDGKQYQLAVNCGPHHLHGGPDGFQNKIWDVETPGDNVVCFSFLSKDGDENYPGNLRATVTYEFTDDCALHISYKAQSDAETVVNLTNHTYFNLEGATVCPALDHELQLFAHSYLETDPTLLPTGRLLPVESTPMDFLAPRILGSRIHDDFAPLRHGKGYDHCFAIDDADGKSIRKAAILKAPQSGRVLTVLSDQPGMQLYTGNWLTGSPLGPDGHEYHDYDCVAIECQGFPDAPNRPEFPSQTLTPGFTYQKSIIYAFSTESMK